MNYYVDIYADGADENGILEAAKNPIVKGFTTNPSLMRAAGITDYMEFCNRIIPKLKELRPDTNISLEVFSDDHGEMVDQALKLDALSKTYGYPVLVKIPCIDTKGETTGNVVRTLTREGVSVNVTAVFTNKQYSRAVWDLEGTNFGIVSIFAGRIQDSGRNAKNLIKDWQGANPPSKNIKLLWASTREVNHVIQADYCFSDIITMTPDLIKKLPLLGKNLDDYSIETVKMFYNDAQASGYKI